jgi:plasmid stabilization system protein ParE
MRRRHNVIWSRRAAQDLERLIEYLADDSPSNALRIFSNLRVKVSALCLFPERGRVVPELQSQGILQYRELIVAPWRIIYRISGRTLYVLSIIDSRQNVEDILLRKLIDTKS